MSEKLNPRAEQKSELEAKIKMYEEEMTFKKKAGLPTEAHQAEIKGLREQLNALK